MNFRQHLTSFVENHPLRAILFAALFVRLIAVFFAQGFLMHDDHFLTIEPSASWAAGANFNDWLPGIGNNRPSPEPISFFYLAFLFVFFKFAHALHLEDPMHQMILMRLLHACYSLLTVVFAYKITLRIANKSSAATVGWLLALLGFLPNFSVRNLVELVAMPPLLIGFWLLIRNRKMEQRKAYREIPITDILLAAMAFGFAVGIRYQTGIIAALAGLILWLRGRFSNLVLFGIVSFAIFFLTQIDDVLLWGGKPFQHLLGYFGYNAKNALNYPGSSWAYFSLIGFFILPPVSIFLLIGYLKKWKSELLLFAPTCAFLLFHIFYPNKQERFILPVLPEFILLGVIGWNEIRQRLKPSGEIQLPESTSNRIHLFFQKRPRLEPICFKVFWILNTILLLTFSVVYSKKSRVEAMYTLYRAGDCKNIVQDVDHWGGGSQLPQFYWGIWSNYYIVDADNNLQHTVDRFVINEEQSRNTLQYKPIPNYVVLVDHVNMEQRLARLRQVFPDMTLVTTCEPGWFDLLLHQLNPVNTKEEISIYKIHTIHGETDYMVQ
jgi:hypothetical protein